MLARIAFVLACCLAALGSASSNQQRRNTADDDDDDRRVAPRYRAAKFARLYHVEETAPVDGVKVTVANVGIAAWRIRVTNDNAGDAEIDWDASTFVESDGEAGGRLIHGTTRKIDTGHAQPRSVVAPGSTATESALVEGLLEAEKLGDLADPGGVPDATAMRLEKTFAGWQKLIVGGKLRLRIEVGGEKKTWVGAVVADGAKGSDDE